jgi:MFS family permease
MSVDGMAVTEVQVEPTGAMVLHTDSCARRAAMVIPLLSSGAFLALMYTAVSPVLSELAGHVGTGSEGALLAQMFMTMPSIGMMVGGIASAWWVGRVGARGVLLCALGVYGLAGAAGLAITDASLLLGSRLLLGLAAAGIATGATTLLAERFDDSIRSGLIGYQSSTGAAVGLLSTLLAGLVADRAGWRMPFSFYLLAWAIALVALWGIRPAAANAAVKDAGLSSANEAMPWRRLLPLYLLCMPLYAAIFMTTTQVPFLLQADGVTSPSTQSWVLAMASMWNAIGAALYGRVCGRLGGPRTFATSLAVMAAGQTVLGLSHHAVPMAIGCALAGTGAGLAVPHIPGMVLARVQGAARGRALGLMYSSLFFGSFCNPLLVAPLAAAFGRHGALLVSALLLAMGAVAAWPFLLKPRGEVRESA